MNRFNISKPFSSILYYITAAVLILISDYKPGESCTSWVAIPPATGTRNTILHKNRDLDGNTVNNFLEISHGLYRYMAICDSYVFDNMDNVDVWAGINEMGLAAESNYVYGTVWPSRYYGSDACREILENCGSVEEAYRWIDKNKKKLFTGNIIFIAESGKAAVVEVKQNYNLLGIPIGIKITSLEDSIIDGVKKTPCGKPDVDFRTNHYVVLKNVVPMSASSYGRYDHLTKQLTKLPADGGIYGEINRENSGTLSAEDDFADSGFDNAICRILSTPTIYRITIEIDAVNPLDSILWSAGGFPCMDDFEKHTFTDRYVANYDFNGVSSGDKNFNIYGCNFADGSESKLVFTEPDDLCYKKIWSPNGGTISAADLGVDNEMMFLFKMTVKDSPDNIKRLDFVFQGYPGDTGDLAIYLRNVNDDRAWTRLGNPKKVKSGSNSVIRRKLDENISSYIDSGGRIMWIAAAPNSSLCADYCKIDVVLKNPTAGDDEGSSYHPDPDDEGSFGELPDEIDFDNYEDDENSGNDSGAGSDNKHHNDKISAGGCGSSAGASSRNSGKKPLMPRLADLPWMMALSFFLIQVHLVIRRTLRGK